MRELERALVLSIVLSALTACGESRDRSSGVYRDLSSINGLAKLHTYAERVNVGLVNETEVTIELFNSPLNEDDSAVRESAAAELSRVTADWLSEHDKIETIVITFSHYEGMLVFHITRPIETFRFSAGEPRKRTRE